MAYWEDEGWKDTYDSWKLASPDDDYEDECEHPFFEVDYEGRAHCDQCQASWWSTADEIKAQADHEAAYGQWVADQERWSFRFKEWLRHWLWSFRYRRATRHWSKLTDDEIPF